jgi:hypothetical protein
MLFNHLQDTFHPLLPVDLEEKELLATAVLRSTGPIHFAEHSTLNAAPI